MVSEELKKVREAVNIIEEKHKEILGRSWFENDKRFCSDEDWNVNEEIKKVLPYLSVRIAFLTLQEEAVKPGNEKLLMETELFRRRYSYLGLFEDWVTFVKNLK